MPQNRAAVREDNVRKGSRIVPLLLLLLAALIFFSYFGPPEGTPAASGFRIFSAEDFAKDLAKLREDIAADVPNSSHRR
jgi:hypothetical protein